MINQEIAKLINKALLKVASKARNGEATHGICKEIFDAIRSDIDNFHVASEYAYDVSVAISKHYFKHFGKPYNAFPIEGSVKGYRNNTRKWDRETACGKARWRLLCYLTRYYKHLAETGEIYAGR